MLLYISQGAPSHIRMPAKLGGKRKKKGQHDDEAGRRAIPRAIIARIVIEILQKASKKHTRRIERKAVDLLHSEIEKFTEEIFTSASFMANSCGKNTLHPQLLNNAVALRQWLIQRA